MWVLEAGGNPDFAQEPLRPQHGGDLSVEHFHRDSSFVPKVPGEVHRGHAAAADLVLDGVTVGKCRYQAVSEFSQSGQLSMRGTP